MTRASDDDDCCCKDKCEDDFPEPPPSSGPPDGGWGWMVVFAALLCNAIIDGICYTIPTFKNELKEYFNCSTPQAMWISSVLAGTYLTVGPLVSVLASRYGCRKVTICGSILSAAGVLVGTQSGSIEMLIVCVGVFGGIGFGMIYLPSIVHVGFWFEKKRAFATGIVVCGTGLGALVFGPLVEHLKDEYGWKGGMVILAGIVLNCAVCGSVFRPIDKKKARPISRVVPEIQRGSIMKALIEEKKRQRTISNGSLDNCIITRDNRLIKIDPSFFEAKRNNSFIARFKESLGFSTKSLDKSKQSLVIPSIKIDQVSNGTGSQNGSPIYKPSFKTSSQSSLSNCSQSSDSGCKDCELTVKSCDAIPGADPWKKLSSDSNLNTVSQSCKSLNCPVLPPSGLGASVISIQVVETSSPKRTRHRAYRSSSSRSLANSSSGNLQSASVLGSNLMSNTQFSSHTVEEYEEDPSTMKNVLYLLKEMFDFHLLKSPMFALLVFTSVLSMIAFFVPTWFIKDKLALEGIPQRSSAMIISVLGTTSIIGRLLSGWIADRPWADALHLNNFALIAAGITVFVCVSCHSLTMLTINYAIIGLCLAVFVSLRSILLVDLLGLDLLTRSFGILILFQGVSTMTGPPILGFLNERTDADTGYYVAGALFILAGLLGFPLRRLRNWETDKMRQPLPEEVPIAEK